MNNYLIMYTLLQTDLNKMSSPLEENQILRKLTTTALITPAYRNAGALQKELHESLLKR
jgi:hypothetical protein